MSEHSAATLKNPGRAPAKLLARLSGLVSRLDVAWLTVALIFAALLLVAPDQAALESLMLAYVPSALVTSVAGGEGAWPIIGASLIGQFAYLSGFAALPLVGGLMDQGMAPGAAMAFLVAGGVTSLPAAIAVYALARPRVFAAYLVLALIGSIASGFAYGALA